VVLPDSTRGTTSRAVQQVISASGCFALNACSNGTQRNFNRGDTEIRGNTHNIGDVNVGKNMNELTAIYVDRFQVAVVSKWREEPVEHS
jgi:hypothetical protein